jgi:hypothetical protein
LRHHPVLSRYEADGDHLPIRDVNLILRFFERVNAARTARSVDLPLLAELVGRHATWLDLAIKRENDQVPREPLHDLAAWSDEFVARNRNRYPYFRNWGTNRHEDFDLSEHDGYSP